MPNSGISPSSVVHAHGDLSAGADPVGDGTGGRRDRRQVVGHGEGYAAVRVPLRPDGGIPLRGLLREAGHAVERGGLPLGVALGHPVAQVVVGGCAPEVRLSTFADKGDTIIPVVITVYADKSFSFVTKTPPAAVMIKQACKIQSGSAVPNKTKVAQLSKADLQKIAETKMPDLNAASLEAAMSMIAGTARSMGITVEE